MFSFSSHFSRMRRSEIENDVLIPGIVVVKKILLCYEKWMLDSLRSDESSKEPYVKDT